MEHEIFWTLNEDRIPSEEQILDYYNSNYPDDEIPGAKEVISVLASRPVNPKTGNKIRVFDIRLLREDGEISEIRFLCLEHSVVTEERNLVL